MEEEQNKPQIGQQEPEKIATIYDEGYKADTAPEISRRKIPRVAVLFCHGMGQQVPYEALTTITETLNDKQPIGRKFIAGQSLFGNELYARVEGILKNDESEREVHFYEAYWAPLTEGEISLWETLKFLLSSGINGMKYIIKGRFSRWIFKGFRSFPEPLYRFFIFLAVLLVVPGIILGIPAVILYCYLHCNLSGLWLAAAILAAVIILGRVFKFLKTFVGDVAIYVSSHKLNRFYEIRKKIKTLSSDIANSIYGAVDGKGEFYYDQVVMVGHSLGSVISYDTLNSLINRDSVTKNSGGAKYLNVLERTKYFVTVGSPLDKTAFIFRYQSKEESELREALASTKQPMINDYNNRPSNWYNIYSVFDPVSAKLRYYDWPEYKLNPNPQKIENIEDMESRTFLNFLGIAALFAHSKYFKHRVFTEILYRAIFEK